MAKFLRSALAALFLLPVFAVVPAVHAANSTCWQGEVSTCFEKNEVGGVALSDGTIQGGVREKVVKIANRVIAVAAFAAVIGIVMAGFHMVTAFGDDEKHKKGKESLKWAILGFALALVSFPLVNAIINFFYKAG